MLWSNWKHAAPKLTWIAIVFIVSLPVIPMPSLAMLVGRSKALAVRSLIEFSVRLPLSLAGVIFFGIPGAIAARLGGALAGSVSSFFLIREIAGIGCLEQLSVVVRPLLALVPAALALHLCELYLDFDGALHVSFVASGAVYCLTYAAFIYLFWVAARRPEGVEASLAGMIARYTCK